MPRSPRNGGTATERERAWSRRWPLPVSLVLAIVYWLYLNEQVSRTVTRELSVGFASPAGVVAKRGLTIRTPGDRYMITELRDASDKVFDPRRRRVRFTIRAPGGHLRKIDTSLPLVVDVRLQTTRDLDARELTWKFTRAEVKDANGELTPFILAMDPPELTVHLQQSDSLDLPLRVEHLRVNLPSKGGWASRVFTDSIEFTPTVITLSGPKVDLDELRDSSTIFVMDLAQKLEKLQSTKPDERQTVAVPLRLEDRWVERGIRVVQRVRASMDVAPEPVIVKGLEVRVMPIWDRSNLDPGDFKVDRSIKVQIQSFNRELTTRLSVPEAAAKWVADNVLCLVRLAEIDPALDPTKSDFVAHLEPHWQVFGDYRLHRDLEINRVELIEIERKRP